jgi:hypothetical protein
MPELVMAIIAGYMAFWLENVLPKIPSRRNVCSIGRMSCAWNVDQLMEHVERLGIPYDREIARRLREMNHEYTGEELFRLVGFEDYADVDFNASQGVKLVHDMNQPIPEQWHCRYDYVFENGTIEHIFDIKQAIFNIAQLVSVGGCVSHASPLDAFNHGFYNFSINFFHDFYTANGFTDIQFHLLRYAADWRANQYAFWEALPYNHEEFYVNPDVYDSPTPKVQICCLARKREHVFPSRVPIQAAYDRSQGLSSRLNAW